MGLPEDIWKNAPNLKELSLQLSYKIFDPVDSYLDNGQIFSSASRAIYLNRAYNKFIRIIEMIHPDILEPLPDYYNLLDLTDCISGEKEFPGEYHIQQLYFQATPKSKLQKLRYLTPEQYLATRAGIDAFFNPSNTERFWCKMNNKIQLLPDNPSSYSKLLALGLRKVYPLVSEGGIPFYNDITVSPNYFDLILMLACMEAMADKGDWNTYKAQSDIFYTDIKLLLDFKTKIEKKDDN